MKNRAKSNRKGVILLIALGMLGLFSILIVSYVITTGQVAAISELDQAQADEILPVESSLENAVASLISGSTDHRSAAYGQSLLEDLYGSDGLLLRVGNRRAGGSGPAMPVKSDGIDSRGFLLRGLSGGQPVSTLFKLPTSLAAWHHDGSNPPDGGVSDPSGLSPELRNLDDALSGRQLTFLEGPLQNTTFQIIRSFGGNNTKDPDDPSDPTDVEADLASCVVIDLGQAPSTEIEINGVSYDLFVTAASSPGSLVYDLGDDEYPGRAGFDDDGDGAVDEQDEIGYPGADDFGYRFVVNGAPFNGMGQNPKGLTGIVRQNSGQSVDTAADIELQFNSRLIGVTAFGDDGSNSGALPQGDEPWDAADFENLFLAWQPSDHRSARDIGLYGGGTELDQSVGSEIIPSFHRPSVINYLMNTPIVLPGENPASVTRTFWEIDGSQPNDLQRLRALAIRIRRATFRPLNFDHLAGDLDGDGSSSDGSPEFTGSNLAPIHWETISFGDNIDDMKSRLFRLGRWLTNGPWDVDNDQDGIPDSIWIDLRLPTFLAATGEQIRPLIAPLIEDLDGRININEAGSYRQLLSQKFRTSNPNTYGSDLQYLATIESLKTFGRGGGVGPAEIDFSHLFDEGTTISGGLFGPIFHTQTSNAQPNFFLYTRYGNLLNTRYGGTAIDYTLPPASINSADIKFPGFGDNSHSVAEHRGHDQLARIPYPAREESFFTTSSAMGKSMDMSGMSSSSKDRYGNEFTDNLTASIFPNLNDVLNQPYENGLDDDTPFSPRDFVFLIDQLSSTTTLDQLLRDELQRNQSLKNLITTESRSIDVPETSGSEGIIGFFANKLNIPPPGELQIHLDRMLAPELRKGTKLNLNRGLGNGSDNLSDASSNATGLVDETFETEAAAEADPIARRARENAFPQIATEHPFQANVPANYTPITSRQLSLTPLDFDGFDNDGDGVLESGTDHDGDGIPEKIASGGELLARHLYCLMFMLIENKGSGDLLVPDFPYPAGFSNDPDMRNRFVARRLAQWAVNAVDFRDTNAICTRLRYDPNPFDGFDLEQATRNVVWGTERPEIEISETLAFHDKRLRRNLEKELDPNDPSLTLDGELPTDEDPDPMDAKVPDSDMDQFRIPEASAFVELRSLRSLLKTTNLQPRLPPELYTNDQLDLGRIAGTGDKQSPVWRLAVGEPVQKDAAKSIRWIYDARRVGEKLAKDRSLTDQIDYLNINAPLVWNDPTNELATWQEAQQVAAEVRPSPGDAAALGEFVTITDDDFDSSNDATTNKSRIELTRFVWFANLVPTNSLNVINNVKSGMKRGNTFFNRPDPSAPNDQTKPMNAPPLLAPGQYALVAPRVGTVFGQTTAAIAPNFEYSPSPQKLEFAYQVGSNPANQFRFNYHHLSDTDNDPETPKYWEDGSNGSDYHVGSVLPIIAQSLTPDVVSGSASWSAYRAGTDDDEEVSIGFNISAPLSGNDYYPAPTHRISDQGNSYPLADGYRDYVSNVGFHPDEPFDHKGLGGGAGAAMLAQNQWAGVGTYQEAVGVFLQRLADPTVPWHPIDNPYLTVDLAPVDLTTLNGEGDVTEQIDRNGNGQLEIADSATTYDPLNDEFTPAIKFDSRRKIPDTSRDRAATDLVQRGGNANDLNSYARQIFTERPALSASFSILRETTKKLKTESDSIWRFELGSMWQDDHTPNDAGINSFYRYDVSWFPYHPGIDVEPYRQTLGFVNREYGRPIGADGSGGSDTPDVAQYGRGTPRGTSFLLPHWDDRDFQSPLDLIHIPAVSRTGLLHSFSPGSRLEDSARRELPTRFDHLLGFEDKIAERTNADTPTAWNLGRVAPTANNAAEITGRRAPFELVLDYVNTGEAKYLSNQWFDADKVGFIPPSNNQARMFNRVVEFLQPPYNYVPGLRTPGRVNLNTTPDYIRKGGNFNIAAGDFLDFGEHPDDNSQSGQGRVSHSTVVSNLATLSPQYVGAALFGNGSVFRSFAWANSTFYDLDDVDGEPSALGQSDLYGQRIDTRFGRGFKAFIESRRGYDTAVQSSNSTQTLGNPNLDWRYPTRFAGVFSTAQAAEIPSVQRFMLPKKNGVNELAGVRRRTHDMSVLRPHPDFDQRLFTTTQDSNFTTPTNGTAYSLDVESDPTGGSVTLPTFNGDPEVSDLRMTRANHSLFDRSLPELHKNFRHKARMSNSRFENSSRLRNVTTHHSNVFLMRLTVGFFVVDPATGAVGAEYEDRDGETKRAQATYMVDRSIPVGFFPGEKVNFDQTILYSILK